MSTLLLPDTVGTLLHGVSLKRLVPQRSTSIPSQYAEYQTIVLLRMSLLPYLLPLKSERALAFEVGERAELQSAVGLRAVEPPSRATLWHFRKRNAAAFRQLMRRGLAVMLIDAERQGIALPYSISEIVPDLSLVRADCFRDPETGADVTLRSGPPVRRNRHLQMGLGLPGARRSVVEHQASRVLLHEELGFPLELFFEEGNQALTRYLVPPNWLTAPYEPRDLTELFGKSGKQRYTACNIIVLRRTADGDEVLLSRRLQGSGAKTFAVPGGKKEDHESVRACVIRELKREVGIVFREGRPVSYRKTRRRGYPPVTSIGILATEWRGEPKPWNREHLAHSPWEWYKLAALPSPLFFPTELALADLRANKFPDLAWSDVEDVPKLPLWAQI